MIKLFNSTAREFSTNGEVVISATKARVKCQDNGDFSLELNCGIEYSDFMTMGAILVVPTPQGEQAFRIKSVTKNKNKLTVKAPHIFYDAENYIIKDSYSYNELCQTALERFNTHTDQRSPFTVSSDILEFNTFRCVRKSLREAVGTVAERWNGHIKRDNWEIEVNESIGDDNGITIEYAKNLIDLTAEYDFSTVVTKLLPVGQNGILLENVYVYSEIQYSTPYTKVVSFDQSIFEEEYTDSDGNLDTDAYNEALRVDLLQQAQDYLAEYSLPKINYTLKGNPEKVTDIGDIIKVKDERIGVDITTNVIAYEYDAIQEKYVSLEFGNFKDTLNGLVNVISSNTSSKVDNAIASFTVSLTEEMATLKESIWRDLRNNYIVYDGTQILVLDALPKESATNVIKISNNGISISNTGVDGTFTTVWSIDGNFNADAIEIINFDLEMISGGTLTLNDGDAIKIYDESNTLIGNIDSDGLIMYGLDGGRIEITPYGIEGRDSANNLTFLTQGEEFIINKLAVDTQVSLFGNLIIAPITISSGDTITNQGIGFI